VIATEAGTTTVFIGNHFEWKNSTMTKYYYAGGQRLAVRNGNTSGASQLSYLLSDHLGSTRLTYRADPATSELASYTPWGVASGNFGTTTAYTYTGQYSYTATFGLMYCQ